MGTVRLADLTRKVGMGSVDGNDERAPDRRNDAIPDIDTLLRRRQQEAFSQPAG